MKNHLKNTLLFYIIWAYFKYFGNTILYIFAMNSSKVCYVVDTTSYANDFVWRNFFHDIEKGNYYSIIILTRTKVPIIDGKGNLSIYINKKIKEHYWDYPTNARLNATQTTIIDLVMACLVTLWMSNSSLQKEDTHKRMAWVSLMCCIMWYSFKSVLYFEHYVFTNSP